MYEHFNYYENGFYDDRYIQYIIHKPKHEVLNYLGELLWVPAHGYLLISKNTKEQEV